MTLDAEVWFAVAVDDRKGKRLDVLLNLFVSKPSANEALYIVSGYECYKKSIREAQAVRTKCFWGSCALGSWQLDQ